jgi:hypothetical protein
MSVRVLIANCVGAKCQYNIILRVGRRDREFRICRNQLFPHWGPPRQNSKIYNPRQVFLFDAVYPAGKRALVVKIPLEQVVFHRLAALAWACKPLQQRH